MKFVVKVGVTILGRID